MFTPKICALILSISINGTTISGLIDDFIANNEELQKLFNDVPGLESLVETYPNAIISLVLFLVLALVGLPLSFPIYWVYMAIYALISKVIFRYSRYQRDEDGKIIRNEKRKEE